MPTTTNAGARPVNPVLASSIRWTELRTFAQAALDLLPFIEKDRIGLQKLGSIKDQREAAQQIDRFLTAANELGDAVAEGGEASPTKPGTEALAGDPEPCRDVRLLQKTIGTIEALADEGFSQIHGIACLALAALKVPEGYNDIGALAQAFLSIRGKATEINDCIDYEAEQVGVMERKEAGHV